MQSTTCSPKKITGHNTDLLPDSDHRYDGAIVFSPLALYLVSMFSLQPTLDTTEIMFNENCLTRQPP